MSGTTADSPKAIDEKLARDGAQFLQHMRKEDPAAMAAFLNELLPHGTDGYAQFDSASRDQAAQRLITSLNELNRKGDLSDDTKNFITKNFMDTELDSPAMLAKRLSDKVAQKDFWTIIANGRHDFGNSSSVNDLGQLRDVIIGAAPGLKNVLGGLFNGETSGDWATMSNDKNRVLGALEEGFDVAMNGGQRSLGNFWGREYRRDVDDREISFNRWNAPGGNSELRAAFFGGGDDGRYQFYDSETLVLKNSFADMIVRRWEETGIVEFKDATAKQAFMEYSAQLASGAALGEGFAKTLEKEAGLQFPSAAARQNFMAFTQKMSPRFMDENQIAEAVAGYIAANNLHYSGDVGDVAAAAEHFVPVTGGAEYAQRMLDFAEDYSGISFGQTDNVEQRPFVSAQAGGAFMYPERARETPAQLNSTP